MKSDALRNHMTDKFVNMQHKTCVYNCANVRHIQLRIHNMSHTKKYVN